MNYIIDGHSDLLLNFTRYNDYKFSVADNRTHVDLPKMVKGNILLEICAVFLDQVYLPDKGLDQTLKYIDYYYQYICKQPGINHINNLKDIEQMLDYNKVNTLLAIEGAAAIDNLYILRMLYKLGVRLVTLTWNRKNKIAEGLTNDTNKGLSDYGESFIKEMNQLGMVIDISHLAPKGIEDVCQISKKPVVASHSNTRAICNIKRNLTEKQLKLIASTDGIIGINFCPEFLNISKKAAIKDIINHINYIKELIGIDYVGLGSDFDGIQNTPVELDDISKTTMLVKYLLANNYTKLEIEKITHKNWLRVLSKNG